MKLLRLRTFVVVAVALVGGIGLQGAARAVDVCTETVPANRFIDGFPAYAQCAGSMNGAIYSDNGINTATTSGGNGWVRTQGSGGYQCTELAHRYLRFRFNVASVPNGNAGVWCDGSLPSGLVKTTTPIHGDLIVLAPGSCGSDATTGHVALVDTVAADMASVMAVQQNSAGRSKYNSTCAACFLHASANDGTGVPDGGVSAPDAGAPADALIADASSGRDVRGTGGAAGTGGVSGTGGAPAGTGGALGSGGAVAASGGAPGSGGAPTGTGSGGAGTTGSNDAAAGVTPGDVGMGCACALSANAPSTGLFSLGLAVAALALVRRRRRRP